MPAPFSLLFFPKFLTLRKREAVVVFIVVKSKGSSQKPDRRMSPESLLQKDEPRITRQEVGDAAWSHVNPLQGLLPAIQSRAQGSSPARGMEEVMRQKIAMVRGL